MFPPDHYLHRAPDERWAEQARTALSVQWGLKLLTPEGDQVDPFTAALNTALIMGSDPFRLMARLHGQCEIHAYVEGPHRAWLAGVIKDGLASGLMREGVAWDEVIALLERSSDGPVVTDYTVCESFPNPEIAGWSGDYDAFFDLPEADCWRMGLEGLRKKSETAELEIRPDRLGALFGDFQSAFSLLKAWDSAVA